MSDEDIYTMNREDFKKMVKEDLSKVVFSKDMLQRRLPLIEKIMKDDALHKWKYDVLLELD